MKLHLLLSTIVLFSAPIVKGQTFASLTEPVNEFPATYSKVSFAAYRGERKMCGVALAGGITAAAGFLCAVGGVGYLLVSEIESEGGASDNDVNSSITMIKIGGGLAVIGLGLGVSGLIHDKSDRWSVVTPNANQFGIAYNF